MREKKKSSPLFFSAVGWLPNWSVLPTVVGKQWCMEIKFFWGGGFAPKNKKGKGRGPPNIQTAYRKLRKALQFCKSAFKARNSSWNSGVYFKWSAGEIFQPCFRAAFFDLEKMGSAFVHDLWFVWGCDYGYQNIPVTFGLIFNGREQRIRRSHIDRFEVVWTFLVSSWLE